MSKERVFSKGNTVSGSKSVLAIELSTFCVCTWECGSFIGATYIFLGRQVQVFVTEEHGYFMLK